MEARDRFKAIQRRLSRSSPIEKIIHETCSKYLLTIEMLIARGTADFYRYSRELYGYPEFHYLGGQVSNLDLAQFLREATKGFDQIEVRENAMRLSAEEAKELLSEYLEAHFKSRKVKVRISTRLTADAAAGANYVKLKSGATYTRRQVRPLACHEGEVHLGTTLNGASQPVLKFLSKGTPRTTKFQEGLAVFAEVISQTIDLERLRRLSERVIGIKLAEDGADFLDLYDFFQENAYSESDAFDAARRCVRGGLINGGAPFTKDVVYLDGLVRVFNFVRVAMKRQRPEYVRFLFVGKVVPEDIPVLYDMSKEGLVREPSYLPEWIEDMRFLAAFMKFSAFLNNINLDVVEEHYNRLMD